MRAKCGGGSKATVFLLSGAARIPFGVCTREVWGQAWNLGDIINTAYARPQLGASIQSDADVISSASSGKATPASHAIRLNITTHYLQVVSRGQQSRRGVAQPELGWEPTLV